MSRSEHAACRILPAVRQQPRQACATTQKDQAFQCKLRFQYEEIGLLTISMARLLDSR